MMRAQVKGNIVARVVQEFPLPAAPIRHVEPAVTAAAVALVPQRDGHGLRQRVFSACMKDNVFGEIDPR